jgi:hypothetical protein
MSPAPIQPLIVPRSLRQEYLDLFCITRRTIEIVREIRPTIWPSVEGSIERFYKYIVGTHFGSQLFFDEQTIGRAKKGMLLHWERL